MALYMERHSRQGTRKIPPEQLNDETPLIKAEHPKRIRPITPGNIHHIVHILYIKAGLIKAKKRRYGLRPHL